MAKMPFYSIGLISLSWLVEIKLRVIFVCSYMRFLQAYQSDSADSDPVGVIVCKQSMHKDLTNRGYIAMLSVDRNWRKRGIG